MATSTNYALALRAVRTARFLEFWANEIRSEMEKQGIKLDGSRDIAGHETITLPRRTINNMVLSMFERVAEIRRFKAPKGA